MSDDRLRKEQKNPFAVSCVVLSVMILILIYGVVVLKQNPHIPLIFGSAVIMLYGVCTHISWKAMRESIIENISESIEAILIICLIGVTIGTWMASGTVPAIIYYGLKIFSPKWFLLSVVLLSSLMSLATGSSWTTAGTLGVAFMGISAGLGIPAGMTAGAVICGAYFGDKQSPLSDSTNFAAAVARTDLYAHTRSMLYTTGPAYLMSLVIFGVLGLRYGNTEVDRSQIQVIMQGLDQEFTLSPLLFLPVIVLIILIVKKFPAIPTMMIAAAMGMLITVFVQGRTLSQAMEYMYSGYLGETGIQTVDQLLTRGGLTSMTSTVTLMLFSLTLAGVLQATGIIRNILGKLDSITNRRFGLIGTTWVTTFLLSFVAADPYLAMILPANILGSKYDKIGLDRSVLSRTLEDGGTVVCPMVPWGTNGIYCAATLGVPVGAYLPYYFLGILTPLCVLLCAATGFGIFRKETQDEARA